MTHDSEMLAGAQSPELYDVVAVDLEDKTVRLMATGEELEEAKAIVKLAVMRRGCDVEFFATAKAGKYAEGDKWTGK